MAVHALAASAFALLDARGSLRLVTDAVHEDDALCLALACRALRDALWARFPARPAGHAHAGKRLRTRDAAVAKLAAAVTTAGVLVITNSEFYNPDTGNYYCGWPLSLPEGIGRLAYLPHPGLRKLDLHGISPELPRCRRPRQAGQPGGAHHRQMPGPGVWSTPSICKAAYRRCSRTCGARR